MQEIWIVEDDRSDLRTCVDVVAGLGASARGFATVAAAVNEIERLADTGDRKPGLLILDLGFPMESGFEVLRELRSRMGFENVKIVVWTAMGDIEQEICRHFGVEAVVPKWKGTGELERAIREQLPHLNKASSAQ